MRIRQIRRTTAFILDGGFTLKKAIKSFTFWCLIISVFEIFMHQIGQDSKSIVLIGFNPILNIISDSQGFLYNFMGSGWQVPCNTITGQISIYWYIGSIVTFSFYGVVLDGIKMLFRKFNRKRQVD